MPRTILISTEAYNALVSGIARDIAKLQPDIVSGEIAPYQIMELFSGYGVFPQDVAAQIIADQREEAARQMMAGAVPVAVQAAA